ncbi:Vitamin B12 import system permease protein BtuC [Cardiobacterium hominis]|jgi:iron chelate ABC superfamily ATP binding cassette transporter, permease protein|nr:Vitamin B12 import system permease protein BtuC [Cardiobacterium hominis]
MNDTPYLHMPRYTRPLLAVLALLIAMAVSIAIGVKNLDWSLFWISRLPRTLAIVLVGASLSVAGLIMQLAVHNRFVEPNTAGTAQGAMLGIVATTLLTPHWPLLANMAVAASCAFAAMLGFLAIARRVPPQEPLLLPLVGLIYGSIIASIAPFSSPISMRRCNCSLPGFPAIFPRCCAAAMSCSGSAARLPRCSTGSPTASPSSAWASR